MHKVGIIGCGEISKEHFQGFQETGRAAVTCVYDLHPESAREKADLWKARVMASADELVGADIDAVVIATPAFARLEYVRKAVQARKHILCEKPVALNLEEAQAIRDVVQDSGLTFMVALKQRHQAPQVTLKQVQSAGTLGGTVAAWAHWYAPASSERWRDIQRTGHWRSSMKLSGGRINEFCSHPINWLLWVLGRPRTVYGRAVVVTEGFTLDDADFAIINCEGGVGMLQVHRHAGVPEDENYGIQGHAGSVMLRERKVTLTLMDRQPREVPAPTVVRSRHAEFLDCIEQSKTPENGIDDAIDTLRVGLAFNRSVETGNVEPV